MQKTHKSPNFKDTLWKLIEKEAHIIKTQKFRLHEILLLQWKSYDFEFPEINDFFPKKALFYTNLSARVQILQELSNIFSQVIQVILRITEILLVFYPDSEDFHHTFPFENNRIIAYKMTEDLIGSVLPILNYLQNPIQLDMLIVGIFKSTLKLTGMTPLEIQTGLTTYNLHYSSEKIIEIMNNIKENSIWIQFEKCKSPENSTIWKIAAEKPIPNEFSKRYTKQILPLINWVVSTWRSLFNIRELYVPISDEYPQADGLRKAIAAATQQGFTAASNVIQNLVNYYQFLLDHAKK
ncbi:MAG: hypothetical protein DRO88_11010 [Promethearchaeia archaeon]|nr:MAG: hypothetical protein DRO88_11010 [Candidatus Lokiarchaeia archaeon]